MLSMGPCCTRGSACMYAGCRSTLVIATVAALTVPAPDVAAPAGVASVALPAAAAATAQPASHRRIFMVRIPPTFFMNSTPRFFGAGKARADAHANA